MRIAFPIPLSIPSCRILGLVQKISSPTSSILFPRATVKSRQPSQSVSPMPSSRSTMGYWFTHDSQILIRSEDIVSHQFDLVSESNCQIPPAIPVGFPHAILEEHDGVLVYP